MSFFVNCIVSYKIAFLFYTLFTFLYYSDAFSGEFEPGGKPEIESVNPRAEVLLVTEDAYSCIVGETFDKKSIVYADFNKPKSALVNIRERGLGLFGCGDRRSDGLTTREALKWAIDEVNKKIWSSSSSNISIGLQIMDSCSRMRIATSQLTEFFPELKGNTIEEENPNNLQYKLGIIDGVGLKNEVDVSITLEELNIPVIRTDIDIISPQGIAIATLNAIQELRWNHIALIHSNSRNSISMLKTFTKSLKKFDLCVPWIINIESSSTEREREGLENLLKSRIPIVSLLSSEKHNLLLSSIKNVTKQRHKIPILFTDLIRRDDLKGIPTNAANLFALVSLPERDIGFEEYFWRNSTVAEMRKEDDLELMERTQTLRRIQAIVDKLSGVLRNLMRDFCENEIHMCQNLGSSEGRIAAFEQLKEEDWSVEQPLYGLMEYQFRKPEGHILLHKVLTYNKFKNVDVFEQNLPYVEVNCENDSKMLKPECNCLEAKFVRRGTARNIGDRNKKQTETKDKYVNEIPITDSPVKKQVDHFSTIPTAFSSFRDPINAILACLILLGAFFTLFTGQYFATFAARPRGGLISGTSVIGYFILLGLFFLYIMNLSFILTPSNVTCTLRRFGISASYAVIFSGMLIKVWTVWKQIKSEKVEIPKPSTLIILSLSFSVLQILFSGLWLVLVPPRIHFDSDKLICYPSGELDSHLLVSMIYVIGILLATAVLAIQASAKNNNYETRWILISSALVAVLFSCWGISIATGVLQNQRTAIMNLVSATILLSCLYIPKIRAHSRLKKFNETPPAPPSLKLVDEFPAFAALPPYPLMLDCNVPPPPSSSENISDSSYSNQAYSIDDTTESMSVPFEIDTSSASDIDMEPLTFTTFFNDVSSASGTGLDGDPTQVVPSSLYPLDMFSNEPVLEEKDHYEPGTNEFTPQHRISSQLYLYPPPEWVP